MTTIALRGLRLHGRHGVHPEEREHGQTFAFDVELEVAQPAEDAIGATVDYSEVARAVQAVSDARPRSLLETLAADVADELLRRFPATRATVTVKKPDVRPGGLDVDYAAVSVSRP